MQVRHSEELTSPHMLFLTVTGQTLQPWAASTPRRTEQRETFCHLRDTKRSNTIFADFPRMRSEWKLFAEDTVRGVTSVAHVPLTHEAGLSEAATGFETRAAATYVSDCGR